MTLLDWLRFRAGRSNRLTVYCMEELLPCPLQVVHPDRLLGALGGIPVVVNESGVSRLSLQTSMRTGTYSFRSRSGTVLATVSERSKDDPYPGRGDAGKEFRGLGDVERDWIENACWAVSLEISHAPAGYRSAMQFLIRVADRIASLSGGLVLDDGAKRYYFPGMRESAPVGAQRV